MLRTAAVVGREFDTPTLAAASGVDEDDVLDVLEPAQVAGLVREDGVDRFRFAHALVRDTLRSSMALSRRARLHARVAGVLADRRGRETEVALHWLGAGPAYAPQAWRAAVVAAELARGLHAYEELVDLLRQALAALEQDPGATARDRYAVLTASIDAYRWAALLPDLVRCVEAAIAVARELDDPDAVARAAIATTHGVLWRSAPPGEVNELVVDALRGSLERLPGEDGELRCRVLLALANELEHQASFAERRALVDEGLAMARRLGDPRLVRDACQIAFVTLWVMPTVEERLGLATESMELARELGDERGFVVSATLRTVVLGELGRRREMLAAAEVARAEARRLRISYGELVLDSVELPWQAMAGRFDRCEELMEQIVARAGRIAHDFGDEALAGATISYRLWDGRSLEALPLLEGLSGELYCFDATITVALWRAGERDRARAWHARHGAPLEARDPMMLLLQWCHAAEAALYVQDASSPPGSTRCSRRSPGAAAAPDRAWRPGRSTPTSRSPPRRPASGCSRPGTPTTRRPWRRSGGSRCSAWLPELRETTASERARSGQARGPARAARAPMGWTGPMPTVLAARNAVALAFALNGLCFATLVSRVPDLRADLGLDNGELGLLLLAIAGGSMLALPSAGRLIGPLGRRGVVRLGALCAALGLASWRWPPTSRVLAAVRGRALRLRDRRRRLGRRDERRGRGGGAAPGTHGDAALPRRLERRQHRGRRGGGRDGRRGRTARAARRRRRRGGPRARGARRPGVPPARAEPADPGVPRRARPGWSRAPWRSG